MNTSLSSSSAVVSTTWATIMQSVRWWLTQAFCGFGIGCAVALGGIWSGFSMNLTDSAPFGLYRRADAPITRGVLVAVCLPAEVAADGLRRGYLMAGPCASGTAPVLKPVAAVAGDTIDLSATDVRINGQHIPHSATADVDSHGRPLPHLAWGRYTVGEGTLWLLSTYTPKSWDSRYYGAIAESLVLHTVQPVLTWGRMTTLIVMDVQEER